MVIYEKLLEKPQVANSLIGMSLSEFDELFAEFESVYTERQTALRYTRRHKTKRQRAVGAGRKYRYELRDRLLMTLFWLRAYMTYEVLGFFYGLDKTNIEDNLKGVLDILEAMTTFNFERPSAERTKLRSVQEIMDAFPDVRLVIDAKEQRIERPANKKDKDGYDSICADYPDKKLYLPFKARRNHPLTEEQKAYNRFLAKYRIIVEHTNAQLNKFQILVQRFRHQLAQHTTIFRVVCGLTNRPIQLHPLKQYSIA